MRLIKTVVTASDIRDHYGTTIAAKAIFEQSRQLRVSIGDVVFLVPHAVLVESVDTITKGE